MIIKLFESQVEKNPDATALIHGNQALTYRELNQRANQLAHYLQQQGVGPEISVGICMDRSLEMMVGLLGILKAGGAYIPLDPNYPEARLTFMIRDATPMFVITQAHLVEKLRSFGVPFLAIDSQWESIANQRVENLSTDVKPDHLAYIIYTSGSTGKPKGVMIEHRSLANFTEVAGTEYAIESSDRVLQFASISFDASVEEIFPCLTRGGTLVLRTDNMLGSVGKFLQFCREMALTILDLPTSFWHQMVADLVTTEVVFPTSLRLIIIGGEKAQTGPLAAWFKYAPSSIRLVNTYGPTEATVVATKYDLAGGALTENVPIGRPLLNVETFILSDHLQPVPVGVPGELYIGGAGLARGYLHQPALTSEKFILNPFSEAAGARLYKTGDLARYLPDGNIEFLGRVDSQVKIRGFRIELGEIEFALQQHPAVKQVIALAREDTPGEKRLVAYIVPRDEELSTAQEWRQFLQSKLPDYMIPSAFVLIEKLPITKNGKIDFQALPVPELTRRDLAQTFAVPRTPAEEILVDIWSEILKYDQVGIHDNFFELGGDSIRSVQITSRANQAGLTLTPNQILQHQTIAELAAVAGTDPTIHAEQGVISGAVPLTPHQKRFLEQDLLESPSGNQARFLELRHAIDASLLEESLRQLLVHHDALRLRITRDGSLWQQYITAPDETICFFHEKYVGLTVEEQRAALNSIVTSLQARLDVCQGPLLTAALVDFGADRASTLIIVIHKIAIDDVSWGILLEDLELLYHQLSQGQPAQLPPKTTSYQFWAQQLADSVQSKEFQEEYPFWLANAEIESAHLPVESVAGAGHAIESLTDIVSVGLSIEDTQAFLTEVSKAYRTMSTDVLLTALVEAFSDWTGRTTLQIALEDHGREAIFDHVDLSRTVGCFSAIYPVLLDVSGLTNPGDKLVAVKELLRNIPHAGIGYGLLRYMSAEEATIQKLTGLPQAEVSFHYMGSLDSILPPVSIFKLADDFSHLNWNPEKSPTYRIQITTYVLQGQLRVCWSYSRSDYQRTTIEGLAGGFLDALKSLITHCKSPDAGRYTPSDFPEADLSQQELDDLLSEINDMER